MNIIFLNAYFETVFGPFKLCVIYFRKDKNNGLETDGKYAQIGGKTFSIKSAKCHFKNR